MFRRYYIDRLVAAICQFVETQLGRSQVASGGKMASGGKVEHAYIDVLFFIN